MARASALATSRRLRAGDRLALRRRSGPDRSCSRRSTHDATVTPASAHEAQGQRPVLVRERQEVQALPQGRHRPGAAGARSARAGRCPPEHRPAALRRRPAAASDRGEPTVKSPGRDRAHAPHRPGRGRGPAPRSAPRSRPGITTDELDAHLPRGVHRRAAATRARSTTTASPSRSARRSTRSSATASPTAGRCSDGDIVNLDVTALPRRRPRRHQRHVRASARSTTSHAGWCDVTRECLERGIAAVRPGRPISDIGRAIQDHAEANRLRRRAGVRRPRHRRDVPHRPGDPALLRAPGHARSWSRA